MSGHPQAHLTRLSPWMFERKTPSLYLANIGQFRSRCTSLLPPLSLSDVGLHAEALQGQLQGQMHHEKQTDKAAASPRVTAPLPSPLHFQKQGSCTPIDAGRTSTLDPSDSRASQEAVGGSDSSDSSGQSRPLDTRLPHCGTPPHAGATPRLNLW